MSRYCYSKLTSQNRSCRSFPQRVILLILQTVSRNCAAQSHACRTKGKHSLNRDRNVRSLRHLANTAWSVPLRIYNQWDKQIILENVNQIELIHSSIMERSLRDVYAGVYDILTNPWHSRWVAPVLLVIDAALCGLIIRTVACSYKAHKDLGE